MGEVEKLQEEIKALTDNLNVAKKDAEEARLEIFTEDYEDFLKAKEGKSKDKDKDKKDDDKTKKTSDAIADDPIKKLEELATKKLAEVDAKLADAEEKRLATEVARFAKAHEDFEQVKPLMYGLSTEEKFKNASLDELYNAAKGVFDKHAETKVNEAKKSSFKFMGERPGSFSSAAAKKDGKGDEDNPKSLAEDADDIWNDLANK